MECLIMAYGRDFEPMTEIFFWSYMGISGHVLAQCLYVTRAFFQWQENISCVDNFPSVAGYWHVKIFLCIMNILFAKRNIRFWQEISLCNRKRMFSYSFYNTHHTPLHNTPHTTTPHATHHGQQYMLNRLCLLKTGQYFALLCLIRGHRITV